MSDWVELRTLQDVAAAQARGDEIEFITDAGNYKYEKFKLWSGEGWQKTYQYRSRPRKQTKKIVLREFLIREDYVIWATEKYIAENYQSCFIMLDTPERVIEVDI